VDGNYIESESGVLLSKLANMALQNGLTGLEFASGIPGTVGGAVVMNAGAYGGEMKDVVIETKYIDEKGNINIITGEQHGFGYRTSIFQRTNKIIVNSKFKLKYGDKNKIKEEMDDLNKRRRDKQPLEMPSAGSIFRRPEGYYAGKLIQDSGLAGYSIGGAQVSPKHCGFIVNTGNATAQDVLQLIKHIQETVKSKFGVELQTEVKVVGEK
jgi:UDP-N-acetylmuramate dehydrogenase